MNKKEIRPQELDFVRLGKNDLDELMALERECFSAPWGREQYALGLEKGAFHVFGLKREGRLAAYASFLAAAGEMEVLNIAVIPEYRRMGLARRLLGLVLGISRALGAKKAFLEVREGNRAARALYEGAGFEQVGLRKGYYPDTGEDALVLGREL
jgi:ribosomal-protein-alanine N-acetyltransferase